MPSRAPAMLAIFAVVMLTVACSSGQSTGSGSSDGGDGETRTNAGDTTAGSGSPKKPPEERPDIVGTVTLVDREDPDILVERYPDKKAVSPECPRTCGSKKYLRFRENTRVFQEDGKLLSEGSVEDFRRGQQVRAWHVLGVAESYPGYTKATEIEIQGSAGA